MTHCPDHTQSSSNGSTTLIIGAGRFGRRSARALNRDAKGPIIIVDRNPARLENIEIPRVKREACDGADFLLRHQGSIAPSDSIVPAVPIHLAFVWLTRYLKDAYRTRQVPVPEGLKREFPFTWMGKEGSLLISRADFRCPEDCPEPPCFCTVTGERRAVPLHRQLALLEIPGYGVHIIRSRQMAPGVGGYLMKDLWGLHEEVAGGGREKWLVGTACRCHGILSALEISPE